MSDDPVTALAKQRTNWLGEWDALPSYLRADALDKARKHIEEVKKVEADVEEGEE